MIVDGFICEPIKRGNPGSNYFHFPGGGSNSLAPKFVIEVNKDFINRTKKNWQNIL